MKAQEELRKLEPYIWWLKNKTGFTQSRTYSGKMNLGAGTMKRKSKLKWL
jgi:hypothetical protein